MTIDMTPSASPPSLDAIVESIQNNDGNRFQELLQQIFFSYTGTKTGVSAPLEYDALVTTIASQTLTDELEDVLVDTLWLHSYMVPSSSSEKTAGKSVESDETLKGEWNKEIVVKILKALYEQRQQKPSPESSKEAHHQQQSPCRLERLLIMQLDASLLDKSGWIPSEKELTKKLRLFNTQHFYKQHKFNLLAEESEGYAKFLTELVKITVEPTTASTTTSSTDHEAALRSRRLQQLDYIDKLIGTFSLDPNRCLDLTVDVMEQQVSLQLLNNHQSSNPTTTTATTTTILLKSKWLPLLKRLPIAHLPSLLAFKIQGHLEQQQHQPNARANALLHTMVWLVEHDVLDVHDMLASLPSWRDVLQETYQVLYKQEKERIRDLGRVRLNAAATPTANAEGTAEENTASATTTNASTPTSGEGHKIMSLAAITKPLRESLAIQWILVFLQEQHWDLIELVLDGEQWSKLCFVLRDTVACCICDWAHSQLMRQQRHPRMDSIQLAGPPWSKLEVIKKVDDEEDGASTTSASRNGTEELIDRISKPLSYTMDSGCISLRPVLYCRLCRILCAYFKQLPSVNEASHYVFDFIRTFLLPNLSAFSANPSLSLEMWAVLDLLPCKSRYSLYRYWRGMALERDALRSMSNKPLWLIESEIRAGKDSRYALKRLSKDTIRDMSRAVAKVCHSHPLVVFTTILNQIESYDNLVTVMVDALRFATPLSLDVLSFCILIRLSGNVADGGAVNRSLLKEDGVNVSQWLQSLEAFVGAFYKRFPYIDFRAIVCYLLGRLKDGHVMELGVLRTLLKTSGGWAFADYSPAASLSISQLEGRAGSTLLQQETMSFGVVEEINVRASNEVRRILQSDDMGVSLLILLAQVRKQIIFGPGKHNRPKPVKLVANLVDNCQVLLSILLDFLTSSGDVCAVESNQSHASLLAFAQSMPSLVDLHNLYGIDLAWAWMLCRPLIRAASDLERGGNQAESEDGEEQDGMQVDSPLNAFKSTEDTHEFLKGALPDTVWQSISTELFELFYSNSLYDVLCPKQVYKTEIARLEKERERLSHQQKAQSNGPGSLDAIGVDEEERAKNAAVRLASDLLRQEKHVATVRKIMNDKKSSFFPLAQISAKASSTFLARCVFPRCLQSPDDSLYCSRFVSILHAESTPGFGTLHFLNDLFVSVSRALFGLTEGEAANLSILMLEMWKVVSRWRYDESAYIKEVEGKPGSYMVDTSERSNGDQVQISYRGYEALYNKWHAAIGSVCLGCLQSREYIHTRNCLIVLTRMVEVFPTRPGLANLLLKTLVPLQEESNSLADIRASALAYGKQLLRARDDGVWKEESIATVKARQAKEREAAVARQKKAAKQMEEIKREAEKITEEIGWDSRGRGNDRRSVAVGGGGAAVRHSAVPPPPPTAPSEASNPPRRNGPPTFEPPPNRPVDTMRGASVQRDMRAASVQRDVRASSVQRDIRGTSVQRDGRGMSVQRDIRGASTQREAVPRDDRWQRESRSQSRHNDRSDPSGSNGGQRSLEDRWQRADGGSGGSESDAQRRKRGRTASPVEDGEATAEEGGRYKRPRTESTDGVRNEESGGGGGRSSGGGGGGRRRRNQRR